VNDPTPSNGVKFELTLLWINTITVIFSISNNIFIFQSHELQGLETYTPYIVNLQVYNPEGYGPQSSVFVMTDEGSKNFTIPLVTSFCFAFLASVNFTNEILKSIGNNFYELM
jgi:hypothetical protein